MSSGKEEFLKSLTDTSYGIFAPPTDPLTGFNVLCDYLLPKGWYSSSGAGAWQVNTEMIDTILRKYSKEYRKDIKNLERKIRNENH